MNKNKPAIWFPAIRCNSGADTFTKQLCAALNHREILAEITWLPHRAEYAPWSVRTPTPPPWANIVHINSWLPPSLIPADLPVVTTLHSCVHDSALTPYKSRSQALYHRHWIYPIEAANLNRAQRITAVSNYTAEKAQNAFALDTGSAIVIHNGVDTQRFIPTYKASPHTPFRLLYVGNWSIRKGVDLIGPIMQSLGSGFELRYTADRSGKHNQYLLPTNCINLGRLTGMSLSRAYQHADALLFPSKLEGLPLTVLEAMACGLPVIAAETSSLPEVIKHGVTGWLCKNPTPEEFILACRKLAQDPDRLQKLSDAAHQQAVNHFDYKKMVERYLAIYYSLLT